jgi:hypothetical protein
MRSVLVLVLVLVAGFELVLVLVFVLDVQLVLVFLLTPDVVPVPVRVSGRRTARDRGPGLRSPDRADPPVRFVLEACSKARGRFN